MRRRAALAAVLLVLGRSAFAQGAPLPSSTLAVRGSDGSWRELWSSASAPVTWREHPLADSLRWRRGAAGLEWDEVELRGTGEAWRTRLIVARLSPSRVVLRLDTAFTRNREPAWSLARAPNGALLAVNAGQFEATIPWGWVAIDGRRWLPPQRGPLSAALVQDSSGALRWVRGADVARAAGEPGVRWAFQSYPALLAGDSVLPPLRSANGGVSVGHRDARAGICLTGDGRLLVALTRFDAVGSTLGFVPFGLTTPEMAAVMGALGCRDAMLLDGGISARLRVRDERDVAHDFEGWRKVPLALIALPR